MGLVLSVSTAFIGASNVATNEEWRAFIKKNFPEIRDRAGGEIDSPDLVQVVWNRWTKTGFWLLQKIDGITAASIASGAYQKYLDEQGIPLDFSKAERRGNCTGPTDCRPVAINGLCQGYAAGVHFREL